MNPGIDRRFEGEHDAADIRAPAARDNQIGLDVAK